MIRFLAVICILTAALPLLALFLPLSIFLVAVGSVTYLLGPIPLMHLFHLVLCDV
jgi:hypothetical protein